MRSKTILAFLIVICIFAGISFAAPTPITSCMIINTPGSYYLSNNLAGGSKLMFSDIFVDLKECIAINASNVVLDCAGNYIQAAGANSTGIFLQGVSNVNISNCNVEQYTVGILLEGANNVRIENSAARNNALAGFFLAGSDNNQFISDYASDNNMDNNTFLGFKVGGFVIADSSNNYLENCILSNNQQYGIGIFKVEAGSNNNIMVSGGLYFNGMHGAYLDSGDGNKFTQYISFFNSPADDLFVTADSVINLEVTNCSFGSNNLFSLNDRLSAGDSYAIAQGNEPSTLPPQHESWNKFVNITPHSSGISIDTAKWTWQDYEVQPLYPTGPDENTLELWKYDGSAWTNMSASRDTSANSLILTGFNPASTYGILIPAASKTLSSCMDLYDTGEYQLTQDLNGAPIEAYELGPDGKACLRLQSAYTYPQKKLVIDCNGHKITNNGVPDSAGIMISGLLVEVRNCEISGYNYGVWMSGSAENATLLNNYVHNNEYGFFQNYARNLVYSRNTISDNENGINLINFNAVTLQNEHFSNNSLDLDVSIEEWYSNPDPMNYSNNLPSDFSMSGVSFDNPNSGYRNYTNISIIDLFNAGDKMSIGWIARPFIIEDAPVIPPIPQALQSFREKFIFISSEPTENFSLGSMIWHWPDSESSGYNENTFEIWKISDDLIWRNASAVRDTSANTLRLNNEAAPMGIYGVLYSGTSPPEPPNGTGGCKVVTMDFAPDCDENVVTIYADGRPFVGANVTVIRDGTNITKGLTDSLGKVRFYAVGGDVRFIVVKAENLTQGECYELSGGFLTSTLISEAICAEQNPPCTKNSDCNAGQVCVNRTCIAAYVPPTPPPPPTAPKCIKDADCAPSEYCRLGSCAQVTGSCGYISNHTWVGYECCLDVYCTDGKTCVSNKCVLAKYRLLGDTSGFVGDRKTITVYSDSKPFPNAQLKVTNPDDSFVVLSTDPYGQATLLLTQQGDYLVELLVNGKLFGKLQVTSNPRELPSEVPKPSDALSQSGIVVILIVLVAALIFSIYRLFFRHKKKARKR